MGKRATRKAKAGDGIRELEFDALRAENLHLKEEVERLRLRNAGAHPASALADALASADDAGDSADDALTMFASAMVIRSELMDLLALFRSTIDDYERRLELLTAEPAVPDIDLGATTSEDASDDAEDVRGESTDEADGDSDDETDDDGVVTIDLRDSDEVTPFDRKGRDTDVDADEHTAPTAKGA
ncbi:MAG: hypothetical protein AAF480_01340 [Actinomycetota bacterium]